jgi:hypothetical protein
MNIENKNKIRSTLNNAIIFKKKQKKQRKNLDHDVRGEGNILISLR